ncbi:MAG TPA: beta-ketoacyl-ACP reductase [Aggregatilineales bacterium]|nr:beta-ketoacyl-ACP reductase [Aggregatilineales bacterium]
MSLNEKVALITGGARGIGRATALRFAREGTKIIIADLDENGLEETKRLIADAGGEAVSVVADVSSRNDVQRLVETSVSTFNALHILINNAGITRDGLTTRLKDGEPQFMSDEKWDAVLNVNLKGTWLCCQMAAVQMIRQGYGRIVNTASIAAVGNIGQANYSASKAGIIGLTRTLALEWARYGITVNCIAPGGVKTPMTETIPEKVMSGLIESIPLKRFAEAEEIAAVHAFLASDDAAYITGQVLFVDGGLSTGA